MDESENIEFLDEEGYQDPTEYTDLTEYDFSSSSSSLSKELKLIEKQSIIIPKLKPNK